MQRHALEHQRLGAVLRGGRDDPELLDHVRRTGAEHRQLGAVGRDPLRERAGGLRVGAHAVRAQRRGDEAHDRRLAARAVHVDPDRDRVALAHEPRVFERRETHEAHEQERERGGERHARMLAEALRANNPRAASLRYDRPP